MREIFRSALAIAAVFQVVFYWLTSDLPIDKFEFTVVQMLAILILVIVLDDGKRRIG